MSVTVQEVERIMEDIAPTKLAEPWDNPGLLVGSKNAEVHSILLALDVTEEVVQEAVEKGINLIISHHPFIFKKISSISTDTCQGRMIKELLTHQIAVYAAHTNWDIVQGGVNDELARKLELEQVKGLVKTGEEGWYKLVIYVPESHSRMVKYVLGEEGAGHIGQYSHCLFSIKGTGQFKPLDGTNPYIGKEGTIEEVEEVRIETIVPASKVEKVLKAVKTIHPYEEMAYDVYPVEQSKISHAIGRIGTLPKAMTAKELSLWIKDKLNLSHIAVAGDETTRVYKVAVCGGAGAEFVMAAKKAGAQYYLTGDVKYHEAQQAAWNGMVIGDAGHFGTEVISLPALQRALQSKIKEQGWPITVEVTKKAEDIWRHW